MLLQASRFHFASELVRWSQASAQLSRQTILFAESLIRRQVSEKVRPGRQRWDWVGH